jgi:hypothetical protein
MHAIEQCVQFGKRIAAIGGPQVEGKISDGIVRLRQSGIAQKQAWWKALKRAAHDAVGVLRFHLAFDIDAQLRERPVGGKDMGEVAEGVLVRVEPRVARNIDAPADDVWPS